MSQKSMPPSILPDGPLFESMAPMPHESESEEEEMIDDTDRCLMLNHIPSPADDLFDNIYEIVSTSYFDPQTGARLPTPKLGVPRKVALSQHGFVKYHGIDIGQIKRLPWWTMLSLPRQAFKVFNKGSKDEHRKDVAFFCQMWWKDDGREPWALVKWIGETDMDPELVNWDELRVVHPSPAQKKKKTKKGLKRGKN